MSSGTKLVQPTGDTHREDVGKSALFGEGTNKLEEFDSEW